MASTSSAAPAAASTASLGKDIFSGFLVSLIALPLCLGIAKASGFPPMGGLITAIIGGLLVGIGAGSPLTIKGPAAGLIAIAIGCVEALGNPSDPMSGYRATLAVIVVASVVQVAFGLLRTGRLGDFFPSSAVHGMLAAIGIIIVSKQVHTLFGVTPVAKDPLALLAEIPHTIAKANPEIAIIGLASLAVLIILPLIKNKYVRMVPAPMVVLLLSIPLGQYFHLEHEHSYLFGAENNYTMGPRFLVTLPTNLADGIVFPDWSQIFSSTSLKYIIMFALVGSLESLLTVKAIDILDPAKRKSDLNRDLLAVGMGNALSGMLGGLPMISEVVRSSANLNNGAKTRWANVAHGGFLLIFLVFLGRIIHQIPLSALAAMLVFTGYRLSRPSHWGNAMAIGWEQFIIFATTVVVTLVTDLLVGIAAGVLMNILINLAHGGTLKGIFRPRFTYAEEGAAIELTIYDAAVFSNWLGLKARLDAIPTDRKLILNLSKTRLTDHSVMENLERYEEDRARLGQKVEIRGLGRHIPISGHPMATRRAPRLPNTTPAGPTVGPIR